MPVSRILTGLMVVLTGFGLSCGRDETARAAPPKPLRFAYQNRVGSAACIVAVEMGFFADAGVAVEGVRFNSGPACSEALFTGAADIGTMGDATAVVAVSRVSDLVILASHGRGEHRHRLVARPESGIRTLADLAGKRVGVKKGTSTYGGLLALLQARGVDASGIRLIDMRPPDMPDALQAGTIDACVASEPTPSLVEVGGGVEVATLGGLGNEYPILLLGSRQRLAGRRDQVRRFLRALKRAEDHIAAEPEKSAALVARITGLPDAVAASAMDRHVFALELTPALVDSLADTARFLADQQVIEAPPDLAGAVDVSYLEAL